MHRDVERDKDLQQTSLSQTLLIYSERSSYYSELANTLAFEVRNTGKKR